MIYILTVSLSVQCEKYQYHLLQKQQWMWIILDTIDFGKQWYSYDHTCLIEPSESYYCPKA